MTRQKNAAPTRKVIAATVGGALAVLLIYALESDLIFGKDLPEHVEVAISTIVVFVLGYWIPPSENDDIVSA